MRWEQYIDTYFFTNRYGSYLADFFEKYLYGHSDLEKLVHFFTMYQKWKSEYLSCSKIFAIESFWAWYIKIGFFKFSLPANKECHIEEWIEKIALLSWEFGYDDENEAMKAYCWDGCSYEILKQQFDDFNYSKEECAKLTGLEFVNELQSIYNRSFERFQSSIQKAMHNKDMATIENNYSIFHSIIRFFETLQNETVIRLNSFKIDEYLWYFIKSNLDFYVLRISDFA